MPPDAAIGPSLLGPAQTLVARLALGPGDRPAGNDRPLEPIGIPTVLALKVVFQRRAAKSRTPCARPDPPHESRESHLGAPRIQSELKLLGYDLAESTVAKYMFHTSKPPSQTWKTFLANHIGELTAIDFFTVPTATFRVLYVFVVLRLRSSPRAALQRDRQSFCSLDGAASPRSLSLRFRSTLPAARPRRHLRQSMGIDEVISAPRSPWQNPYVERLIGSIRRECLDHVIVLNEPHLKCILTDYFDYYQHSRTHLSLELQFTDSTSRRTAGSRTGASHSASRRLAPPLYPRRLTLQAGHNFRSSRNRRLTILCATAKIERISRRFDCLYGTILHRSARTAKFQGKFPTRMEFSLDTPYPGVRFERLHPR